MAEQLRHCPSGHSADVPHTNELDDSWVCCCDDPQCCWRYDGNNLSQEEAVNGWNRRVPGPATKAMLNRARAVLDSPAVTDISPKREAELRAFLAEWAEPATPPTPEQPKRSSPWKCEICGQPVGFASNMRPYHVYGPTNHEAELSSEDLQTLANGLRLTD